jgi:hypothetical protein
MLDTDTTHLTQGYRNRDLIVKNSLQIIFIYVLFKTRVGVFYTFIIFKMDFYIKNNNDDEFYQV